MRLRQNLGGFEGFPFEPDHFGSGEDHLVTVASDFHDGAAGDQLLRFGDDLGRITHGPDMADGNRAQKFAARERRLEFRQLARDRLQPALKLAFIGKVGRIMSPQIPGETFRIETKVSRFFLPERKTVTAVIDHLGPPRRQGSGGGDFRRLSTVDARFRKHVDNLGAPRRKISHTCGSTPISKVPFLPTSEIEYPSRDRL